MQEDAQESEEMRKKVTRREHGRERGKGRRKGLAAEKKIAFEETKRVRRSEEPSGVGIVRAKNLIT